MSFGSPGRKYSGSRNFSGRKERRRKQEFHEHRARRQKEEASDLERLRERVVISLRMLGRQRLSAEVGGYSLESWVRNFNLLLEDFAERVGPERLPPEYVERRSQLSSILVPPDTSHLDAEIDKTRREEAEARRKMQDERADLTGRIDALKDEQARAAAELEDKRRLMATLEDGEPSGRFFRRLLGKGPPRPSADTLAARTKSLESSLESLPGEVARLQAARSHTERRNTASGAPYAEDWLRIESLERRLSELEESREALVHLTKERELVATAFVDIISRMSLGGAELPQNGGGAPST